MFLVYPGSLQLATRNPRVCTKYKPTDTPPIIVLTEGNMTTVITPARNKDIKVNIAICKYPLLAGPIFFLKGFIFSLQVESCYINDTSNFIICKSSLFKAISKGVLLVLSLIVLSAPLMIRFLTSL
jgi:hypothetical protein